MKAIVTGAAGFIGCHVSAQLLARGWEVLGLDNLSRRGSILNAEWLDSLGGQWTFVHVDIRNSQDVSAVFRLDPDVTLVIHAAGQVAVTTSVDNPQLDFDVNAMGTFNLLEACRHFCPDATFIFTSTNKVYGSLAQLGLATRHDHYCFAEFEDGINEDAPLDFHSPYGCSKGAADQYVRDYARIYNLRTVVCRQSCIYGTRQFGCEDQGWIAWFLIAALAGLPVCVYGDGRQVRDVLWIDDLVELYFRIFENSDRCAGKVYNVGGGRTNTLSINELIEVIPSLCGRPLTVTYSEWRTGDQRVYVSDISKASVDLGWRPEVSIHEGLRALVEWQQKNLRTVERLLKTGNRTHC